MRILVVSDTHGNLPLSLKACEMAEPFTMVVHLGDGAEDAALIESACDVKVLHVAGNCDMGSASPRELLWDIEGKKLLLVHGDAYGVKNGLFRLEKRALEAGVDAVLFGHTHRATVTSLSGILAVNPGSLMRGSLHPTFATLEISPQGITAQLHDIQ